jgi:hypothetical protein
VDELIRRIGRPLDESSGRFPMIADPRTGEWTWPDDGAS